MFPLITKRSNRYNANLNNEDKIVLKVFASDKIFFRRVLIFRCSSSDFRKRLKKKS